MLVLLLYYVVRINNVFVYLIFSSAEWEAELQKELTDYEVVGGASAVDDAALEKEIMDEMNKSGEDLK